ncbi:MAG: hypothetical protein KDG89_05190 [Geminicoccaceae bacterium]|nr:hypothetical protein [Geminicoccaceae bacterium]
MPPSERRAAAQSGARPTHHLVHQRREPRLRRALLLGALLVLAALAAATLLVLPDLAGGGALAKRLAARGAERAGVEVRVRGPSDLRLLPSPRLVLHDVEVTGGLTVDRLDVDLAPLPLLVGRAEAETVRLVRPSLRLAAADLERVASEAGAASPSGWPARVEVEDGRLAVQGLVVTGLAGEAAADGFRFEGAGGGGALALQGRFGPALKDGRRPVEAALSLDRGGGTALLDWRGVLGPGGALKGRVGFGAQDPALLAALVPGLEGWNGEAAPEVGLEAGLDWGGGRLRLDEAVLTLDGRVLKGALDLDTEGKRLALDLGGGDLALAPGRLPWPMARLGPPGGYEGEVGFAAERLRLGNFVLMHPRLRAALKGDGTVILREARADLPEGAAALEGILSLDADAPAFAGTLAASGVDLATLRPLLPTPLARLLAPYARAAIDGRIDARPGAWAFDDARLDLDGARFEGRFGQTGATFDVAGRLDRLTLAGWPSPDALEKVVADATLRFDLAVDRATVAAVDALAVRLAGEAAAGRLDLRRFEGDAGGGRFDLRGRFEADQIKVGLDLALDAPARFLRRVGWNPPAPLALLGPLTARLDAEGDRGGLDLRGRAEGEGYEIAFGGRLAEPFADPLAGRGAAKGRLAVTLANEGQGRGLWRLVPGGLPPALTGAPTRLDLALERAADGPITAGLKGHLGDVVVEGRLDGAGTEAMLAAKGIDAALLGAVYDGLRPALGLIPRPFSAQLGRWPTQPLTWGWLQGPPLRLRLDLDPALDLEATREAGALDVRLGGLDLGGGRLSGRLGLDGAAATLKADLDLEGADLGRTLALLGIPADAAGALGLAADFEAAGRSPADLARTLRGKGRLAVRDARLPGLDGVGGRAWREGAGLKGGFTVEQGIARSEADGLRIEGGGETGRVDGLLDLFVWLLEATVRPDAGAAPVLRAVGPPGAPTTRLVRPLGLGGGGAFDAALPLPGAVARPRGPASSPAGPIP